MSNLGSVRRVKSSQGSRRGTCGWITSIFFHSVVPAHNHGPVAQLARAPLLQSGGLGFKSSPRRGDVNVPTGPHTWTRNEAGPSCSSPAFAGSGPPGDASGCAGGAGYHQKHVYGG